MGLQCLLGNNTVSFVLILHVIFLHSLKEINTNQKKNQTKQMETSALPWYTGLPHNCFSSRYTLEQKVSSRCLQDGVELAQ